MNGTRSVPELLSDLAKDLTGLFRNEGQLIRAEVSEKISQLQMGAGTLIAGAICMLAALLVLLQALVIGLTHLFQNVFGVEEMGPGWSSLIVGVVVALVGVMLLRKGTSDLSPSQLTPERSLLQVRKDADLAKEQIR